MVSPDLPHELDDVLRDELNEIGVTLIDGPVTAIEPGEETIALVTDEGRHDFASIYPALGSDTHVALAVMVGASLPATSASQSTATSAPACPGSMPPAI
jgi:thioredoxin reductase (NADPH)